MNEAFATKSELEVADEVFLRARTKQRPCLFLEHVGPHSSPIALDDEEEFFALLGRNPEAAFRSWVEEVDMRKRAQEAFNGWVTSPKMGSVPGLPDPPVTEAIAAASFALRFRTPFDSWYSMDAFDFGLPLLWARLAGPDPSTLLLPELIRACLRMKRNDRQLRELKYGRGPGIPDEPCALSLLLEVAEAIGTRQGTQAAFRIAEAQGDTEYRGAMFLPYARSLCALVSARENG